MLISNWQLRCKVAGLAVTLCLAAACGDGPSEPPRGDLVLVVTTTGASPDPDGYLISLDEQTAQPVAANQTLTLSDLEAGPHELEVSDVAVNCNLAGANPRTVTVLGGQTTQIALEIACGPPPGALVITVTTSGWDIDPDGYTLMLDATPAVALFANDDRSLPFVAAGVHTVSLVAVAPNCAVRIPRQPSVTINSGQETGIAFTVLCSLASGPTAEQILYESGSQVFVVQSDGTGATPLTSSPGRSFGPSWSPDRTRIAFPSDRAVAGEISLWTALADGSNPLRLSDVVEDRSASWSPDGTRLVFSSISTEPGLYVINSDGTGRVRITDGPTDDSPAWSPDGTRIAFNRDNGLGTPLQLYMVAPDGSGLAPFPTPGVQDCGYVRWAPDGTRLAFSGYDGSGGAVWVINDDGSGLIRLSPPSMVGFTPSWSPTGDRLAFIGQRPSGDGIYTMAPDGTGLTLRLASVLATSPAWAK